MGGQGMKIKDILKEAESLPLEERVLIVDSLLRGLNPPESNIDRKWIPIAQRRLQEIRSGAVKAVPGDEVFEKIRKRFEG